MPKQPRERLLDGRCDLGEDNLQGSELGWRRGCELGTGGALLEKEPIGEGNLEGRSLRCRVSYVSSCGQARLE
jgi:hypothetical protein